MDSWIENGEFYFQQDAAPPHYHHDLFFLVCMICLGIVRSLCDIPSGVSSSNISLQHILKECESTDCVVKKETEILVSYSDGLLSLKTSKEDYNDCVENKWSKMLKYIKLADDCHSYNIISQISTDDKCIKLSTTQTIPKGKQLLMWFTPEILAAICVPFLTPINIQDTPSDIISKFKIEGQERSGPSSVGHHQSAFRPYHMNDKHLVPTDHLDIQNKILNPYIPALSLFSDNLHSFISPQDKLILGPSVNFMQGSIEQRNLIAQQAVDMESFVSNLGKSKQGHLCIYCGKIYSRKYGLKIHIRTHTGFKPLKCKYCFRPFGDPSNLNKHVRLHAEGETPYKCELCSKILVRRRDLERHMKSRHHIGCSTTNKDSSDEKGNHQNPKISTTYTR
ncbi:PR/SET domain 13 [Lycorma delicatula]|uniref:PR/SET domain 13 n=1 Tax=Lycorma delicatula TaxID=130591 RepID=UPI003F51A8A4